MPFERPTLAEITARTKTDLQTALAGTAAFFRDSIERRANRALATVSHTLHGHLAWIARQVDPRSAEAHVVESVHGEPFGVYKKDATKTKLVANAPGSNGKVVPAGTVFTRFDGARYLVDSTAVVESGVAALALTAETAGAAANCDNGDELDIESPILGVTGTATVTATTTTGADRETPADYLVRVVARRQNPPRGGAGGDYETWALEVAGVTRAWEFPRRPRAGWVTVFAVNDAADPITLEPAKVTEVAAHITTRAPSTVDVFVATPELLAINHNISLSPDDPDVKAAVLESLAALYRRVGTPAGQTIPLSQISEAISIAAGERSHVLNSPSSAVVVPFGSLPVTGVVNWS